jgi:hypothetical protein
MSMPNFGGQPPSGPLLERARSLASLTLDDLWLRYFGLGGDASPLELDGFLAGVIEPTPYQYDIVAQALNERFTELKMDRPVPYAPADGTLSAN